MTINDIQNTIIDEFALFDDWMDKYQLLIEMGSSLAPLTASDKTDDHLIDGCQSRVWIVCHNDNGVLSFTADSDALIVKGIIALLLRVVNNHTAEEIITADLYFIHAIGLDDHLSPTRANGLVAMLQQIRRYAQGIS